MMASLSSINNNNTNKEEGELSSDDDNYTQKRRVTLDSQVVGSRRLRNVDANQSSISDRYLPRNHRQNHNNADRYRHSARARKSRNDQAAPYDLRQKLSERRRVTSYTRPYISSSVKGFHLSKYKSLRDRRKPFFEPEYKNQGSQIEVHHQRRNELARKVKERQPGELMGKRKQDSLFDGRVIEHQRENDYTVSKRYPSQDLNQKYTSAQDSGILALSRTPPLSYHHDNGYSIFPLLPPDIPYQRPPVPLPAAAPQGISHAGSLSDSQKLQAIRYDERRQNTFSDDIEDYECPPVCNFLHLKPQAMTSNYKSPRNLTDVSDAPVNVLDRLGPEVDNGISDIQTGLDDTYPRASFRESAENMYNRNTFSNGNQLFSDVAATYDTTNIDTMHKTTTAKATSGGASSRHVIIKQMEKSPMKEIQNFVSSSSNYAVPQSPYKIDRTAKIRQQNLSKTDMKFKRALPEFSAPYVNTRSRTLEGKEDINISGSMVPQLNKEATDDANLASSLPKRQIKQMEKSPMKEIQNFVSGSSNYAVPQSPYKIDRTAKIMQQNLSKTDMKFKRALPEFSAPYVNTRSRTLEGKEDINISGSMVPQLNKEATDDANLASSLPKCQDSVMQENWTKTRDEQKKQKLEYYHKLAELLDKENQQNREKLNKQKQQMEKSPMKVKKNFISGSSNYAVPQSPYKIDRTAKIRQQNLSKTDKKFKRALPEFSAPYVNTRSRTLEGKEDINISGSMVPQLNKEATDNANLASSLPKRQKVIDLQAEPKRKETKRCLVYSNPLNVFEKYRNKQASAKESTEGQNKSDVVSPAETQEASAKESSEGHNKRDVMKPAEIQEASAKESTEAHNKGDVVSPAEVGN